MRRVIRTLIKNAAQPSLHSEALESLHFGLSVLRQEGLDGREAAIRSTYSKLKTVCIKAQLSRNWKVLQMSHCILHFLTHIFPVSKMSTAHALYAEKYVRFVQTMYNVGIRRARSLGQTRLELLTSRTQADLAMLQQVAEQLQGGPGRVDLAKSLVQITAYAHGICRNQQLLQDFRQILATSLQKCNRDSCYICAQGFDSASGVNDYQSVVMPQCGHPLHQECLISMASHERNAGDYEGRCRTCKARFEWDACMAKQLKLSFGTSLGSRILEQQLAVHVIVRECANFAFRVFADRITMSDAWLEVLSFFAVGRRAMRARGDPDTADFTAWVGELSADVTARIQLLETAFEQADPLRYLRNAIQPGVARSLSSQETPESATTRES
eukprot:TRINITY_DN111853_c0_g1_i1.p1 TRINITY_DN111853_c0_g1~~TRINITY_DN111853_c0_g1_i1.p1  ORF type:complete len:384 (-),score=59.68 TRINITY_DN111853_c0_g1_i1:33-1184(-)